VSLAFTRKILEHFDVPVMVGATVKDSGKQIKVLHIITGLNDGGAEAVLYRMVTAKSASFKHIVVSLMDAGKYGLLLEEAGVDVYYLNMSQGKLGVFSLFKLYRIIRNVKPGVVQTWMFHGDLLGGVLARLAGVKNVVWGVHHTTLVKGESKRSTILIAKLNAFLSRYIPSKIIYCAEKSREVQETIGFARSKGVVVSNGYDVSQFIRSDQFGSAFKNYLNLSDNFLIGNIGRYDPQKDHKTLLLALKEVKAKSNAKWHCILVGTNLDEANSELTGLVHELGLTGNVRLIGRRNDIPAVMNAIDLFVLSSSFGEAFPNVLNEAMACGTPCVTTDVGDAALIVGGTGWTVSARNPQALAHAIMQAIGEKKFEKSAWETRKSHARARIVDNFSIEKMIAKYERVWMEGMENS
jgi:glycosyltransferase involved in cell wall biosynthesis